ncbi:pentatricopeptide repeat-containing protein [Tanacetum coccineum]
MFLQMQSIGYKPDGDVSNYLISSLCKVDQYEEAVQVLWSMSGAGCIPDLDNFGSVIGVLGDLRKKKYVEELIREMVSKYYRPKRDGGKGLKGNATPKAISPKVTDRRSPRTPTSEDWDREWESELKVVQKHHSMDSAALASAMNEIQKLKIQLEKVLESETTQAKYAD